MQQSIDQNICILDLTPNEVRDFFLNSKSYFTLEIPTYFVFDQLLKKLNEKLLTDRYTNKENPLSGMNTKENIRDKCNVNYKLYHNKDGKYAWRPLQIINPALYVALVHKITEDDNWKFTQDRFKQFKKNENIECTSVPVKSNTTKKDKAEQICVWWKKIEQRSIELALDYEYLIKTDITDCYGSIYTHSISWALHGKDIAKENRQRYKLLGNEIDGYIQDMSNGQTNGIPQGSVLMDFIAEIVLGYADSELSEKIEKESIKEYKILRYRDDYRIFVNNSQDGEIITKLLSETLIDLGLKLNAHKTQSSQNIIRDSIKSDKLFWITQNKNEQNLQKKLIIIHNLAVKFPNSGSIKRALSEYLDAIPPLKDIKEEPLPLISVLTDIACYSPDVFPIYAAILNQFIKLLATNDEKKNVFQKIHKKFKKIPNIGHLDLWLQRISIKLDLQCLYDESLCKLVSGEKNNSIWELDGIDSEIRKIIEEVKIVDQSIIDKLPDIISRDEYDIFNNYY